MSEGLINNAMVAIMRECSAIGKDSKNAQQGFNFRGVDAIMNALHPVFAKHGVYIMPEIMEERHEERQTKSGGNLIYRIAKIKWHFIAEDGSEVTAINIGEGMDSGDKAMNKAMAVAMKYVLTQSLILPYDEVDPDSESHSVTPKNQAKPAPVKDDKENPFISEAQRKRLYAICKQNNVEVETLKAYVKSEYGIESSTEIYAGSNYEEICKWVENGGK